MQKNYFVTLAVVGLLLCGSVLFGHDRPILGEAVEMAGAGRILVIPPEHYDKSVEDALAAVRCGTFEDVISVALVEVRKKYPGLKLENLALRDFSPENDTRQPFLPADGGAVVIYFKDRSADQTAEVREGASLVREQLYRVEFVFTKGMEAVYVQMSPPPAGLAGMLKDQEERKDNRPPRPSRAMLPQG